MLRLLYWPLVSSPRSTMEFSFSPSRMVSFFYAILPFLAAPPAVPSTSNYMALVCALGGPFCSVAAILSKLAKLHCTCSSFFITPLLILILCFSSIPLPLTSCCLLWPPYKLCRLPQLSSYALICSSLGLLMNWVRLFLCFLWFCESYL